MLKPYKFYSDLTGNRFVTGMCIYLVSIWEFGGGWFLKRMPWDDVTRRQSFMLKADAGIGIAWGKWMSSLPRLADHRARSRQVCDQVWQALKNRRQELLDANCELIVNLMSHWHTSSKLLFGTSLLEYHTGFRYIENTGVNTSIR